ncbi:Uncharacterized protein FWK35_00025519, partial [Aphis craccivora]
TIAYSSGVFTETKEIYFPLVLDLIDSERSDECIDFTMTCVCVCVCIITKRNNDSISNFEGGFRWQNEYPWCIIEKNKKKKKSDGKTGIFTQNQFSTKLIFLYGCNSKTNHSKYLKFSPYVPYEFISHRYLKISPILNEVMNFKFLRNLSKTRTFASHFERNDNDLSSNDFKYFISRRYLKILPFLITYSYIAKS